MAATDTVPYLGDNPSVNAKAERGKRKREGDSDDMNNVPKKSKKNVQPEHFTRSDDEDTPELLLVPMQKEVR